MEYHNRFIMLTWNGGTEIVCLKSSLGCTELSEEQDESFESVLLRNEDEDGAAPAGSSK